MSTLPQPKFHPVPFKNRPSERGFTLIELLITIVIIGILAVIGLNNFITSQIKARDAQRKSDLLNIGRSLEMYYNDKGRYPAAASGLILGIAWGSDSGFTDTTVSNGAVYMAKMPADPGEFSYYYTIQTNGTGYALYANLENTKDSQALKDVDGLPITYSGTNCGGVECNYAVTSPNLNL